MTFKQQLLITSRLLANVIIGQGNSTNDKRWFESITQSRFIYLPNVSNALINISIHDSCFAFFIAIF